MLAAVGVLPEHLTGRIGLMIRCPDPESFRPGEWGEVWGVQLAATGDRLEYLVRWPSGECDAWLVEGGWEYEWAQRLTDGGSA